MKTFFQISFAFLTFTILLFASPKEGQAYTLLREGDQNAEVTELQEKLIQLDYLDVEATGVYGPLTKQAVINFQHDFGLAADGLAGIATLTTLEDVHIIAKVVYGEARGESFEGQVAVAAVVLNRVESPDFPFTVSEVVFQRNAFTAVHDGQYDLEPNANAYQAVKEAWTGTDPTEGAHYYFNPDIATSAWIQTRTVERQIGNHVFAN